MCQSRPRPLLDPPLDEAFDPLPFDAPEALPFPLEPAEFADPSDERPPDAEAEVAFPPPDEALEPLPPEPPFPFPPPPDEALDPLPPALPPAPPLPLPFPPPPEELPALPPSAALPEFPAEAFPSDPP